MRFFLLTTTVSLAAACTSPEVDELRSALPDDRLAIDDSALRSVEAARGVGEDSEYYDLTMDGIDDVNGGILDVLAGLDEITSYRATYTREDDTALWGPWYDDASGFWGKLWVRGEPDGSYSWAESIRPDASDPGDWSDVVNGHVDAGASADESAGRIAIDFTTIDLLGAGEGETGKLAITYELRADGAEVSLGVGDFAEDGAVPADGAVHYDYDADGGTMDWKVQGDLTQPPNGSEEDLAIHSRWNAAGAGRADAQVTGGDFGPLTYTETDCWDLAHRTVFYESTAELRREGDESDCAF